MTLIINGTPKNAPPDPGPPDLESTELPWGIFYTAAGFFLGRLVATNDRTGTMLLSPAYSYIARTEIVKGQGISRVKFVLPLEQLVSAMSVEIPPCPVVWIRSWDDEDRKDVREAIASAEDMRTKLAASRAGITLAPAGAKLPPPPIRGL